MTQKTPYLEAVRNLAEQGIKIISNEHHDAWEDFLTQINTSPNASLQDILNKTINCPQSIQLAVILKIIEATEDNLKDAKETVQAYLNNNSFASKKLSAKNFTSLKTEINSAESNEALSNIAHQVYNQIKGVAA